VNDLQISVIVPAYNAAATLGRCLAALSEQTLPPGEILVVDDGSRDETVEIAHLYDVHVISQANAGPAAARNTGASVASGDLLLFTDADCAPARDWVERLAAPFVDLTVVGAKGIYQTNQAEPVARFVQIEYEDKYDRMRGQEGIDFVDTYSAAYRRDIFLEAGGFDTSFPTASVEDQELSFRLAAAGRRLVFVPDARVTHIHDRTLVEYVQRKFWIGFWKALVTRRYPSKLARDSHTPQTLKLQMALVGGGGALFGLGALLRRTRIVRWGLVLWAAFGCSTWPFVRKAWRKDRGVAALTPLFLFVRAWALGMGFLLGNLRWLTPLGRLWSDLRNGSDGNGTASTDI
jgi:cellulose synthase/poly-beta-1,6-N-acetylglucosamine synthase-like glycosyltransferase